MARSRIFSRSILLGLAMLSITIIEFAESAKKKRKVKSKPLNTVSSTRCGVCFAVIDEVLYELRKTENSTSTLDLRWGLTAEVTEGRAKRIGKVIPYKRSQLRSIEIMEKICENMKDYGKYEGVSGETQLKRSFRREDDSPEEFQKKNQNLQIKTDRDDQKKFERLCEELVEENEALITQNIRDELNMSAMEDSLCFGSATAPCGVQRSLCQPGSIGERNGTMPCDLCAYGKYQGDVGKTECLSCGDHENTTERGMNSSSACLKQCKPGSYSTSGLEPCYECGLGTYQPSWGSRTCEACENGLGTNSVGSLYITECVSVCGDFKKSTTEECDDGNEYPGDGCSEKCTIEESYSCNAVVGQKSTCNKVLCGDGKIETSHDGKLVEICDDNNTLDGDGCSSGCKIEAGWSCSSSHGTPSQCSKVVCGDGNRQNSADGTVQESCDDGNLEAGDGCNSQCQVEENAVCDGPKEGRHTCHIVRCGDGLMETVGTKVEQCDDSNTANGDGCSESCEVESGWDCEEGIARWGAFGPVGVSVSSRHSGTCKRKEICGDGHRVQNEKCDDGNLIDGDGCSSNCTVEDGFSCSARGSQQDSSPPNPGQAVPDKCEKVNSDSPLDEKTKGSSSFFGNLFGSSESKSDL